MTDAEPTVTIGTGDVEVVLHPAAGARIGQIIVRGQSLLIDVPPPDVRHPTGWGCFAMVPWAGRVRHGRFRFRGVEHQLPINHHDGPGPERAHAIHGLTFDRPWPARVVSDTTRAFEIGLDWSFGGTASQTVTVFEDRVEVTLTVSSTGVDFPAVIGWHPWFRRPARIELTPTAMYQRDEFGLPTGSLVEPSSGPWDDCFLAAGPVRLHDDRTVAPTVTVDADCDHWVVYSEPHDAICVEPQSGPPDAFNLTPRVEPHTVTPATPLVRSMTISW
jgi:aldose 1-epimerase